MRNFRLQFSAGREWKLGQESYESNVGLNLTRESTGLMVSGKE
jgi:hypothetical protein